MGEKVHLKEKINKCIADLIYYSTWVVVNIVAIVVGSVGVKDSDFSGLRLLSIITMSICAGIFIGNILWTSITLHKARKRYKVLESEGE